MNVVYKKKIYQGKVELRDYELRKFIATKKPLKIYVGDEFMVLTHSQLKKGIITNTQHSIINKGQTYRLVGFDWKPQKNLDESVNLYQAFSAMPESIRQEIRKKLGIE